MSSPCGKCNTCPCSKKQQPQVTDQREQSSCAYSVPPTRAANCPSPATATPTRTSSQAPAPIQGCTCSTLPIPTSTASQANVPSRTCTNAGAPTPVSNPAAASPTQRGCGVCAVSTTPASTAAPASCACQKAQAQSSYGRTNATEHGCARPPSTTTNQRNLAKPKVECLCANNRTRGEAVQAPLADSYTCSRPRTENPQPVNWEERCNCNTAQTPPACDCSPPQAAVQSQFQAKAAPTNAHITCGQGTPVRPAANPYVRPGTQCGHCASQRKKKCVIQ